MVETSAGAERNRRIADKKLNFLAPWKTQVHYLSRVGRGEA